MQLLIFRPLWTENSVFQTLIFVTSNHTPTLFARIPV